MSGEKKAGRTACKIIHNKELIDQVYEMVVEYPAVFSQPEAGQFVNLYCHHQGRLLPRPLSVCEFITEEPSSKLRLVYAVQGEGTREFSGFAAGDEIELLGPFGNGFTLPEDIGTALLIGGGVGTPPMVELAKRLFARGVALEIVVGFRTRPYLLTSLERYGTVHAATESGLAGFRGNVVELILAEKISGDHFFACGPQPMLRGVQELAARMNIPAQLSLEERMGCGFGGCVGCVAKVAADNAAGFVYKKVCKDGPVFLADEVLF